MPVKAVPITPDTKSILSEARKFLLLNGLTDSEKNDFLSKARVKNYERGQYLFSQGDSIRNFYIVCNGVVRSFRTTPDGDEVTTDILIRGDTLCEMKIFRHNTAHPDYALVVEDATVLEIPAPWLRETVRKHSALSINMLSTLSRRSMLKDVETEHQATMSAAQIVTCFLRWLCNTHSFDEKGFTLPYSKALISSRLGMKQETFSRTLHKLKENGIDLQGTRVVFHDIPAVDKYACAHCSFMDGCPARMTRQENNIPSHELPMAA